MPLLYLALAAGAILLWRSGAVEDVLGGSSCAIDAGTSDAVRHQITAFLSEEHTAEEHAIAAGMLDAGGYPRAADCVRASSPAQTIFSAVSPRYFQ